MYKIKYEIKLKFIKFKNAYQAFSIPLKPNTIRKFISLKCKNDKRNTSTNNTSQTPNDKVSNIRQEKKKKESKVVTDET